LWFFNEGRAVLQAADWQFTTAAWEKDVQTRRRYPRDVRITYEDQETRLKITLTDSHPIEALNFAHPHFRSRKLRKAAQAFFHILPGTLQRQPWTKNLLGKASYLRLKSQCKIVFEHENMFHEQTSGQALYELMMFD
jgi:hypothetical protein